MIQNVFRLGKFCVRIPYISYIIIQDDRLGENYRDSLQSHTVFSRQNHAAWRELIKLDYPGSSATYNIM